MNVTYDPRTDTLSVVFKPGPVAESDDDKPGVVLDYDEQGRLVGLEILDASKHVPDFSRIDFRVAV
ncbi:MAG: DUF2283 domain-containing protein [Alphaproteobacteria bacterium]